MRKCKHSLSEQVQSQLAEALVLHRAGELSKAVSAYECILRLDSAHAEAKHFLGMIASQLGEHQRAIELVEQAASIAPKNAVVVGNLGVVLRRAGRTSEAIDAYERAIALDARHSDAFYNLGRSHQEAGRLVEARVAFEKGVGLSPNNSVMWLSLQKVCAELGDLGAAAEWSLQSTRYCHESLEVWLSQGAIYRRQGQLENAVGSYRSALAVERNNVAALTRLATVLFLQGKLSEGQFFLEQASALEPSSERVLLTRGLLYKLIGNWSAAIEQFEFALKLSPQSPKTLASLAECQRHAGKPTESRENIQRALELSPGDGALLAVQGGTFLCLGKVDEALASYRAAVQSKQGRYCEAHQNLLVALQYRPGIGADFLLQEHVDWDKTYASALNEGIEHFSQPRQGEPLRIGFVSADLGAHPVGYFTARLFECLDRKRWQTFVYSDRVGRDWLSDKLRMAVYSWSETRGINDEVLAKQIRDDKIDILIDLAGHTANNRLLVFARRAAPLQVSWAGYVGTTGLSEMDCVLADLNHAPVGSESSYTEKILRMPNSYVTFLPHRDAPAVQTLPALSRGCVTFGAVCNPAKVNRYVLKLWAEILRSVPMSRLLLCYAGWPDPGNRQRVESIMEGTGCAGCVEFLKCDNTASVLALYNQVDIALDTFPYSGGLTTCEAMWMGVPTVTLPGDRFASRHALNYLSNVGLFEYIASSSADYVSKAIIAANDLSGLAGLRASLRSRMQASPLLDGESFANNFSEIMLAAWKERGENAASPRRVTPARIEFPRVIMDE